MNEMTAHESVIVVWLIILSYVYVCVITLFGLSAIANNVQTFLLHLHTFAPMNHHGIAMVW